jgi:glycosyltransferase involved in cell wall biosynthesis
MAKISVVIPCYNYHQYVGEAIESALNQTWKDKEVIVVDDGSTDNSAEVIKQFPVKYIYQKNQGLSAARNTGIRAATGEKILCLDSDDIVGSTYLELAQGHKGIVICGMICFGGGNLHIGVYPNVKYMNLSDLLITNRLHCASIFDKSEWEKIGGYDEQMKDGYEDWEFWIRMRKAGVRVTPINEILFFYRKHGVSMVDSAQEKDREIREYIYKKHYDLYHNGQVMQNLPRRPGGICEFCGTNKCEHYPL